MMRLAPILLLAASACAGCGDDGGGGTYTIDIDNGTCGTDVRFTGEIVDWDSNAKADFCGVFNSMVSGTNGGETTTAPNGRFDTCVPKGSTVTAAGVTPPSGPTPCSQGQVYTTNGTMIADPATIQSGAPFSIRLFTDARKTSLYQQIGAAFDPAKGHLLVHVYGDTTRDVSISSAHDTAQAYTESATAAWAAGTHGDYVFFPNVTLDGTTTITSSGQVIGAGPVTPVAGQITGITIYTR